MTDRRPQPRQSGRCGALISRGAVHAAPVVVIGVQSVDDSLEHAEAAGAERGHGKQPIPGIGWSAYVRDPEGNVIGLFQPDEQAPDR